MSAPRLHIVGIGADGLAGLGERARMIVERAEILVGGKRHLAMVEGSHAKRIAWRSPIADTLAEIERHKSARIVVLASGDPLWHGIGRLLADHFGPETFCIHPAPSAFQLTCARLGWALEHTATISLHGHPLASLRRHLNKGARLVLLTDGQANPGAIASLLAESGYGDATMHVFEDIGAAGERHRTGPVQSMKLNDVSPLNTVALNLDAGPVGEPSCAGLPDNAYAHDGQLTKWEMRAMTLAALAPRPGELLWDVGAGAGSIAIEWLRSGPGMQAVAVEQREDRIANIRTNAETLGVPELVTMLGTAPADLPDTQAPDAIFLGGGVGADGMVTTLVARLRPGGCMVANAVTLAGERALLDSQSQCGGELRRIGIDRLVPVGPQQAWRPAMPVTQWRYLKP